MYLHTLMYYVHTHAWHSKMMKSQYNIAKL